MARFEDYSFGRIVVNGEEQTRDLIVTPDRVVTNWRRRKGHSLCFEDLGEVEGGAPLRRARSSSDGGGAARHLLITCPCGS